MHDVLVEGVISETLLIDDEWIEGDGDVIAVIDPSTEQVIARVVSASDEQVERAVGAARRAFDSGAWSRMRPEDRSIRMHQLIDLFEAERDAFADLLVTEIGSPIGFSRAVQVGATIECLRWFAEAARSGPRPDGWERVLPLHEVPILSGSLLRYEPVGVVAGLTAYNYPLLLLARKLGAVLASGCTTVILPSPRAPLSTIAFMRLLEHVDIPSGTVNLLVGGPGVGVRLTQHPDVDAVSFTGSRRVGQMVMAQAAPGLKNVVLELGGKSPNILLPDADVQAAVGPSILRFAINAGQGCGATTRTLVPRGAYDEYVERSRDFLGALRVGDPRQTSTVVGPLIREEQREFVQGFVDRALSAGAVIEAGGGGDHPVGYFMDPLLVGGVGNEAEIAQEELFGPVGVLIPYTDLDDALAIANDSRYGLNANVWGPLPKAIAFARKVRTGTVTINGGGGMRQDVPWGGFGHSGLGREAGEEGFRQFLEVQHIQWPMDRPTKPFGME